MMTREELDGMRAKAIFHGGLGHRVRAFWWRLMVTELGDLFHCRVWPNRP